MKKIAVIGGGASGLVAAIAAARSNPKVQITIYEQKDSVGKKILATGNGRCNLTNKDMKSSYYRSENIPFVEEVLEQFGYEDTIRFSHLSDLWSKKEEIMSIHIQIRHLPFWNY